MNMLNTDVSLNDYETVVKWAIVLVRLGKSYGP